MIGTIEGHSLAPDNQKSTKYEHVIPQLVDIEEDPAIEGLLVILNTVGGDVEAGLALAELISGVSKPSATLVLGGGHSIGIPLAVSARKSFIVPTATMTVHPVRHSGMVLGVPQTLRYFEQMQERIVSFVAGHSGISARRFTQLMHNTGELVMDMGTVLGGEQAVEEGLIDAIASKYGSQFVVAAIDAKKIDGIWRVTTHGGKRLTERELFAWAHEVWRRGAGEILFTSMDHDGTRDGYPCETFARLAELPIPVIASGGAGSVRHIADVLTLGKADAALAASIFHYNEIPIPALKRELHRQNINVRL